MSLCYRSRTGLHLYLEVSERRVYGEPLGYLFISMFCVGRPNIEIEAKFGVVLDKGSGSRVAHQLGIWVETSMWSMSQYQLI